MPRNWQAGEKTEPEQAWVYAGLVKRDFEDHSEWQPHWIPVEVVRGDIDKVAVRRDDGRMAVVRSFKVHYGGERGDSPGWTEPKWFQEDEIVYA